MARSGPGSLRSAVGPAFSSSLWFKPRSGPCRNRLKPAQEVMAHHVARNLPAGLSGNDIDIKSIRGRISVQSKTFANNAFDPVSGYGIADLFGYGNAKTGCGESILPGNEEEIVAVMATSVFGQRPVFDRLSDPIRLSKCPARRKRPLAVPANTGAGMIRKRVFFDHSITPPIFFGLWPDDD